ncbi:MAG: AI-2E family transporter [Rhodomicrobium sp.]
MIAAIPAVLVAATQGTDQLLWTLAAYLAIHTAEGNFIAPLIQRQMVYIPPAVMILGIAAIGLIFGPVAVIFAVISSMSRLRSLANNGERTQCGFF